ncbi:MAG: hypothetical protein ABS901_02975 [Candidatus Limivicinus sp.]|jgi:hypothetical protein
MQVLWKTEKSLARILILVLVFTLGSGFAAYADDEDAVNVVVTDEGDTVSVVIDGEVWQATGETIAGMEMLAHEGAEDPASVHVGVNDLLVVGNASSVAATATDDVTSFGVGAISIGKTSVSVTAEGNVAAETDIVATGARVRADDGGSAAVTVGGDLTAIATEETASGAELKANDGGETTLTVNGQLTADGEEKAIGVDAQASGEGAEIDAAVTEGIAAAGPFSVGASLTAIEDAAVILQVGDQNTDADLVGGTYGLVLSTVGQNEEETAAGTVQALVTGTISGGDASIVLTEGTTTENVMLTVWAIDLNAEGQAVLEGSYDDQGKLSTEYTDNTRAFEEKQVFYIIKVEQPAAGATLTAVKQDGSALDKRDGFEVANESDIVLMKVDLQEGYRLTGAFSDLGQSVEMLQDAAGNYYVVVPKGGAVYLSATLENMNIFVMPMMSNDTTSSATGQMATVKMDSARGCYVLTLTARDPSMTFLRQTLTNFMKLSDLLFVRTEKGEAEFSLSEILSYNEKAVNFRFTLTDEVVEIFANGELAQRIEL